MYTIGHFSGIRNLTSAQNLRSQIQAANLEAELFQFELSQDESPLSAAEDALLNSNCDIYCISLESISGQPKDEIVIAGLSGRNEKFDILIYNEEGGNTNHHIKLNDNASVIVTDQRSEMLAHSLFEGWSIRLNDDDEGGISQALADHDGIILPNNHEWLNDFNLEKHATFQFHPKEFIPHAAQNVTAYLIKRTDKELRKLLSGLHISDVSQATNIERTIDKELINRGWTAIAVYCVVDHNAHYHVYVGGVEPESEKFKRTRYSSSTSENIVINVYDLLSKID